jgi:PKD repeat protein
MVQRRSKFGLSTTTTHTYRTAGTYVATLTVTDEGWAESSAQVAVTATGKK